MDDSMYRLHAEGEESYWWFLAKNRIILSLIRGFDRPEYTTACDIGCGTGGLLRELAKRYNAVGVDMHPLAREYCIQHRGLRALDGSLPDGMPFPPESFDVIVCSEVLEHVERDAEAARAVVRLLKPGGLLVCTVPAHQWMWSVHDEYNHHFRRYSRAGFGALFASLPVERLVLSYGNCALFPVMAGVRLLGRATGSKSALGSGGPQIKSLPKPVNSLLTGLFATERYILPRARLPMGSSVIAAFRKQPVEVRTVPDSAHAKPVAHVANTGQ